MKGGRHLPISDRIFRLCLRAFPDSARRAEGDMLVGLASDLSEQESAVAREAVSLLASGLMKRARVARRELPLLPWREALGQLALPLAAALSAVVVAGAASKASGLWVGWSWAVTLLAAALSLAGVALGRRRTALSGSVLLLGSLVLEALRANSGQSRWTASIAGVSADVLVLALPAAFLLVASTWAMRSTRPREHRARLAWSLLPSAGSAILAAARPTEAAAVVVYAAFAVVAVCLVASFLRPDPSSRISALLALAVTAPALFWLAAPAVATDPTYPLLWWAAAAAAIVLIATLALLAQPRRTLRLGGNQPPPG